MAIKPQNSKSATRTQTASWQYDSASYANGEDNNNHPSYKKLKQYSGNQHGGAAEGNFGRGATKGNTNATGVGPKNPPTSAHGTAQVRTPGGTRKFEPSKTENYNGDYNSINFGRGPTKGNSQ